MRIMITAALAAMLFVGSAQAQSVGELRAQLEQTKLMLQQGEAAGMDAAILSSLRESLAGIEESIREMEAEAGSGSSASDAAAETPAAGQAAYPTKPNLAATPACRGFTEDNYRQRALAEGNDLQLRTMCGQAFEYYTMYKRAIAQGYSEDDSNRTYAAHEKSALVANDFYANNRAD